MKDLIIASQPYVAAALAGLLFAMWKSDTLLNISLKLALALLSIMSLFTIFWGLS